MHEAAPPFAFTSGSRDARLVFVGEAHGEQEQLTGLPFIGNAGQEFTRLCEEVGIDRRECLLTNVFAFRPLQNSIPTLCGSKKDVGAHYTLAPLKQGQYVLPEYLVEVNRLKEEIEYAPRNLVVALGAVAAWALLGKAGIGAQRGTTFASTLCPGIKVLPTYHPSYLFKMWQHRPIVLADLMKAERERHYPEVRRPERWVLVDPTLAEIETWFHEHALRAEWLAPDVETLGGQIKIFGVAASASHAISIPFVDLTRSGGSYWRSQEEEICAWSWIARLMALPQPKIFQNGLFDLQYILDMGIPVVNATEDTMLLHHALYPELQKGLGFLGSVYTNEQNWKIMRGKPGEELKRDE